MASLVDGDVLSQKLKPRPHEQALRWIESTPQEETYLSVITLQEARTGIDMLNSGPKREGLEAWIGRTRLRFHGRILPVTEEIAEVSGRFTAQLRKAKKTPGANDMLLAATAYVHGLSVATLNVKHFEELGVELVEF